MVSHTHLVLSKNGLFSYKNKEYPVDDILYLEFFHVVTKKHYAFRETGKDHNVNVKIGLKGRATPLSLNSGPRFVSLQWTDLGENSSIALIIKYQDLAKASFDNRVKNYLSQIDEKGFFWYDGKKIEKNGAVIAPKWSFNLKSVDPIYIQPFAIYRLSPGPFRFFKRKLKISTLRDSDCFSYLMKFLYGLSYE